MQEKTEEQASETKQERVQVTLRLPKDLHDALEGSRPKDQALNPYITEVLEAGLAATTTGLAEFKRAVLPPDESLIAREEALRLVTGCIDGLVRRTGSRIDTRDIESTPPVKGLRTLVKEALLSSK